MKSLLYQISHPWHWLTYGQNGIVFAASLSLLVSALTVYVLIRTLHAVKQQARAADRQAEAAEEQAKAARAGSELARAQLWEATRERRLVKRRKQADDFVLEALSTSRDWAGPGHPMTGAGIVGVRADEVAEHLKMKLPRVDSSLRRLRAKRKVIRNRGTLDNPAPYWLFRP